MADPGSHNLPIYDEPANYNEIKQINWGTEQPGEDVESLELGPNNCGAN